MKVEKIDNNRAMTPAQTQFCRQLEHSDRSGQVFWWPRVADGQPDPDCVVFLESICRFAVMFLDGGFSVRGENWYCHDAGGAATLVPDPIETARQAAQSMREAIKGKLGIGAYTIPVAVFADMEPDAGIMKAAQDRKVKVLFGQDDVVERLANLPDEEQLQPQLNRLFIQQEMTLLRRLCGMDAKTSENVSLEIGGGKLVVQHADVVNVYVTGNTDV